jgi:hypothetical protein
MRQLNIFSYTPTRSGYHDDAINSSNLFKEFSSWDSTEVAVHYSYYNCKNRHSVL